MVHGEEESQEVLRQKIIETTQIPVTIPEFGATYTLDLNEEIKQEQTYALPNVYRPLRLEIIERIETLKEEVEDMGDILTEGKLGEDTKDEELEAINQKIKQLEKMIVSIIE